MKKHLTEKALKEAVIRADQYDIDSLPPDSQIDHEFSRKFLEKMQKLICQSKKTDTKKLSIWRKKLAAGIVAILILLSITAMAIPVVRAQTFEFIQEVYKQFTHIFFNSSEKTFDDTAFHKFIPTYIPEGFNLVTEDLNDIVILVYEKETDNISYEQMRKRDASMHINTEGVELENLKFQGFSAKYYSNQGVQNLIWYDDEYVYTVSSTLDRNAVFKIAESVKPSEN